jgi:hypothetical protein
MFWLVGYFLHKSTLTMIRFTLSLFALGLACMSSAQLPFRYITVSEVEINNAPGTMDLIDTYKAYLLDQHPEHGTDWNFYTSNEGNGYFVFSYADMAAMEAARDAQAQADPAFWQGMMADAERADKFMNADRLWDWTSAELYELKPESSMLPTDLSELADKPFRRNVGWHMNAPADQVMAVWNQMLALDKAMGNDHIFFCLEAIFAEDSQSFFISVADTDAAAYQAHLAERDAKREANAEYQALVTQFESMVRTTEDVYLNFHLEQSLNRAAN